MTTSTINPPATHLVVGVDQAGRRVYYTGAAGEAFISTERERAFVGWYESGAQVVAARLNRGSAIHGITFRAEAA